MTEITKLEEQLVGLLPEAQRKYGESNQALEQATQLLKQRRLDLLNLVLGPQFFGNEDFFRKYHLVNEVKISDSHLQSLDYGNHPRYVESKEHQILEQRWSSYRYSYTMTALVRLMGSKLVIPVFNPRGIESYDCVAEKMYSPNVNWFVDERYTPILTFIVGATTDLLAVEKSHLEQAAQLKEYAGDITKTMKKLRAVAEIKIC